MCVLCDLAGDQLGDEFACSSYVIIGDVDCTAEENQNLCEKMEVNSYPTIKYWKDGIMEDYQGGRDFDSLKQHVVENLLGLCNVADPKDCTRKENAYIEKMKAKTQDQIESQHANLEKLEQWLHQRLHILESLREERRTNFR